MFRWINDLPIKVKSLAGSAGLLICLVGLGTNALGTLTHWVGGLHQLSRITLPQQDRLRNLLDRAGAVQLDVFRYVAWSNNSVSESLLTELRFGISKDLNLVSDDLRSLATESKTGDQQAWKQIHKDWNRFAQAARDTIEISSLEAPMGTMMLGGVDDLFANVASALRARSGTVGQQAQVSTRALEREAENGKLLFSITAGLGGFLGLVTTLLIARSITGPIQAVTAAMVRVARGETGDDIEAGGRRDEIGQMLAAISTFREKIERDNSELAAREQQLTTQNMRFNAALKHMSPGLVMFDKNRRLIVCNDQYARLYRLPAELTQPGTTLERIWESLSRAGVYTGPVAEQYIKTRLTEATSGEPGDSIIELDDGRVIAAAYRPMSDGGWVATHDDITERRRAETEREQAKAFLNTIIENVPTTIIVKDARDRRYVLVNKAAEDYFACRRDKILGKTAHEVWPEPDARVIGEHDDQLLRSDGYLFFDEHKITRGNQALFVTSKRILIRGADGKPQFLVTVIDDVSERKRIEERIAYLAHHDALTDLPNRVSLLERLERELAHAGPGKYLAVHYLDIDRFKEINDTLGHTSGDEFLKAVAKRLRSCLGGAEMVARLGGDEFAVVQTAVEHPAHAGSLAQRIGEAFRTPYELDGHSVLVGVSIGIAIAPDDGSDSNQLLRNADLALYRAKADGRGVYRFFEAEMDARVRARRALEVDLRNALENGEFELHYQPIIDLDRNEVSGCEALLRWRHPKLGMIPPAEFIPVAEDMGLITPLGEWVLRTACKEAANWPEKVRVAVNVSPIQFKSQSLALLVADTLHKSDLAAGRLEIEITETVVMQQSDATLATLRQLQELGVRISMDDFGTGYSSLRNLRSFPFDKIKIDRSFVETVADADASASIVRSVIGLANSLKMTTTAEGVESHRQVDMLRAAGCTEIQGYLVSRPLPAADVYRLFSAHAERAAGAA